jgi:MoxR-like ATPase
MGETARDGGLDEVLVEDILRVITRIPLPRGQHLLFKLLLESEDGVTAGETLVERVCEGEGKRLGGVLGALSKRIAGTRLERRDVSGLSLVLTQETIDGRWFYTARPELRAAVHRLPALRQALDAPWEALQHAPAARYHADGIHAEAAAAATLTDEEIRSRFEDFRAGALPSNWAEGIGRHAAVLERIARLTDDEFRGEEVQRLLWSARDVGSCARGEMVRVDGAFTDAEVIDALAELRALPALAPADAQARFDAILELVAGRHARARPAAKLSRAFAILQPAFVHAGIRTEAERRIATLMGVTDRGLRPMERRVLAMARLNAALPPFPADVTQAERAFASAQRSSFLRWIAKPGDETESESDDEAIDEPGPIDLLPFERQARGMATPADLDTMRRVVRLTLDGESEERLVQALLAEEDGRRASATTWSGIVYNARSLQLLEMRGHLLHPTTRGDALLEDDGADVLVEALVIRVFGIAQTLRLLAERARTRGELHHDLRRIYPQWTSPTMPGHLLNWLRGCELVEPGDASGQFRLTQAGASWAKRLPDRLPAPPMSLRAEAERVDDAAPEEPGALRTVPLDAVADGFDRDAEAARLVVDSDQLRLLHLAWHSQIRKRFVILSGLSGTGKTAIARAYARVVCAALGLDVKAHLEVVSVAPDWRDPAGLLGYLNPLHADPTFHVEPALLLLRHAAAHPAEPHFLVLDEMNLAPVERYFAPFLSSMETGERLRLHAADDAVNGVPPTIAWPSNLYIAGTVNMDESTHPISDKVLDRAFTLEFWDVDLVRYFARRERRQSDAEAVLLALYEALRPARRHFGYRTAGEVLDLLQAGADTGLGDADRRTLLDQAVHAKVLPRLRGQETDALRAAFTEMARIAREHGLRRCGEKIAEMHDRLRHHGVTQFWS